MDVTPDRCVTRERRTLRSGRARRDFVRRTAMITILVGVDASEHSRDAIAFAGTMARASSARVIVACAFDGSGNGRRSSHHGPRFALRDEAEFIAQRMSRHLHGIDGGRLYRRAHPATGSDHGVS